MVQPVKACCAGCEFGCMNVAVYPKSRFVCIVFFLRTSVSAYLFKGLLVSYCLHVVYLFVFNSRKIFQFCYFLVSHLFLSASVCMPIIHYFISLFVTFSLFKPAFEISLFWFTIQHVCQSNATLQFIDSPT